MQLLEGKRRPPRKISGWLEAEMGICTSRPRTSKVLSSWDWKVGWWKAQEGALMRARHQDLTAHCHLPHRTPGLIEQRKPPAAAAAGPHLDHEASAPEKQGEGGLWEGSSPVLRTDRSRAPFSHHLPSCRARAECEESSTGLSPGARSSGGKAHGAAEVPWGSGMGRLFFREGALSATAVGKVRTFAVRFGCWWRMRDSAERCPHGLPNHLHCYWELWVWGLSFTRPERTGSPPHQQHLLMAHYAPRPSLPSQPTLASWSGSKWPFTSQVSSDSCPEPR